MTSHGSVRLRIPDLMISREIFLRFKGIADDIGLQVTALFKAQLGVKMSIADSTL